MSLAAGEPPVKAESSGLVRVRVTAPPGPHGQPDHGIRARARNISRAITPAELRSHRPGSGGLSFPEGVVSGGCRFRRVSFPEGVVSGGCRFRRVSSSWRKVVVFCTEGCRLAVSFRWRDHAVNVSVIKSRAMITETCMGQPTRTRASSPDIKPMAKQEEPHRVIWVGQRCVFRSKQQVPLRARRTSGCTG